MEGYSDEDLIKLISANNSSKKELDGAFTVLMNKYSKFIWYCCNKVCDARHESKDKCDDLYTTILGKIYNALPKFDLNISSYIPIEERLKKYISKTADTSAHQVFGDGKTNLEIFVEEYEDKEGPILSDPVEFDQEIKEYEYSNQNFSVQVLNEALSILKSRDREIFIETSNRPYIDEELYNDRINTLCKLYSTTRENIRVIRHRTIRKLKDYIIKHTDKLTKSKIEL